MQETLNSKKKGDTAFGHKDFSAAIDCYTQVILCLLIARPVSFFSFG